VVEILVSKINYSLQLSFASQLDSSRRRGKKSGAPLRRTEATMGFYFYILKRKLLTKIATY